MEIRISLEKYADVALLKKFLTQIKGVKKVSVIQDGETESSWEEIENSEYFQKIIDQSEKDFEEGKYIEHSKELLKSIFNKK